MSATKSNTRTDCVSSLKSQRSTGDTASAQRTNCQRAEWQAVTSHSCSCRALKSDKKAICAAHPSRNDAMMLWISPLIQFTLRMGGTRDHRHARGHGHHGWTGQPPRRSTYALSCIPTPTPLPALASAVELARHWWRSAQAASALSHHGCPPVPPDVRLPLVPLQHMQVLGHPRYPIQLRLREVDARQCRQRTC